LKAENGVAGSCHRGGENFGAVFNLFQFPLDIHREFYEIHLLSSLAVCFIQKGGIKDDKANVTDLLLFFVRFFGVCAK
jgi:hypothetical protein